MNEKPKFISVFAKPVNDILIARLPNNIVLSPVDWRNWMRKTDVGSSAYSHSSGGAALSNYCAVSQG
ncbi:MAG: hypothetical protein ACREBC_39530 [Pyrinomonadaceae bacterium]